ncbi:MAG: redoxin domain-containing protein [Bacteroidia bacterium]|nr:redoxin domain-containing protein [Bacteroidia bacterium]
MKQIWLILVLIQFACLNLIGQTTQKEKLSPEQKESNSLMEQKILQLEKEFFNAKLENNVKFLGKFFADDFVSTNQFGHVRNKAQSLAFWAGFKPRSLTQDKLKVTIESDTTALVEGYQTENGEQFSISHRLIKHNSTWQILTQVQKFPEFQKLSGFGYYKINGYLRGAEGVAVSLIKIVSSQQVSINAAIVKNGMFTMEGQAIEYPIMTYLVTPGKREQTVIFLENSEITLSGHVDSLAKAIVKGSKTQDEYLTLLAKLSPLREKYEIGIKNYQSARNDNDTARLSKYAKELSEISEKLLVVQKDYIKNNPGSFVVPVIFYNIAGALSTQETDGILKSLNSEVSKTWEVLTIKERNMALKAVDIGKKAPDFTLNDMNGNPVSLSSKTGCKLLLIDFWAGWCAPCRKENPNLVKIYQRFKEQGFEILGVSLDRTREEWAKAVTADSLSWTQVSDLQYFNSKVAGLYSVTAIPANFLLDEKRVIIARNLRGEALRNKVTEILGEK